MQFSAARIGKTFDLSGLAGGVDPRLLVIENLKYYYFPFLCSVGLVHILFIYLPSVITDLNFFHTCMLLMSDIGVSIFLWKSFLTAFRCMRAIFLSFTIDII